MGNYWEVNRGEWHDPIYVLKTGFVGFPGGAVVKKLPANEGDTGLSPGPRRSHMPRSS